MEKTINNVCVGQVDIYSWLNFDFLPNVESHTDGEEAEVKRKEGAADTEDYLKKEEVITNLARQKYEKELSKISISDIEEALFSIKIMERLSVNPNFSNSGYQFLEIASSVAKKVIRPIIRKMTSDEDMEPIRTLLHPRFQIHLEETTEVSVRYAGKKEGTMLRCVLEEEGFPPIVFYGLKEYSHDKNRKNVSYKDGTVVADIGEVIASIVIISQVLIACENADDMQQGKIKEISDSFQATALSMLDCESLEEITMLFPNTETLLLPKSWSEILAKEGVRFLSVPKATMPKALKKKGYRRASRNEGLFAPLCFMQTKELCYHMLLPYRDEIAWAGISSVMSNGELLATKYIATLFVSILEEKFRNVQTKKYLEELTRDCAKSYQTKKNIPKKMLQYMKESGFNDYFGFVEYDESVDLEKAKEIEHEFRAFKETYLPLVSSTDNSIRFRLLGKHKASGLYYPFIGCLCVDVRNPSSLIHEYGHLLDYKYGSLSRSYSFKKLRDMYERHLNNIVESGAKGSAQLQSKTKYSMDYYLIPTEIFARCFELYISKVLGMKNSLVPSEFGWEYPTDDEFLIEVETFFEGLPMFSKKIKED